VSGEPHVQYCAKLPPAVSKPAFFSMFVAGNAEAQKEKKAARNRIDDFKKLSPWPEITLPKG
jgi:hypothetical protein